MLSKVIMLCITLLVGQVGFADLVDDFDQDKKITPPKKPTPAKEAIPGEVGGTVQTKKPPGGKDASGTKKKDSSEPETKNQPIHLKSQGQTLYSRSGNTITLNEDVIITQGPLRLKADKANVVLNQAGDISDVNEVEVIGNVRVSKYSEDPTKKVTARGDKALFYNKDQKVTLVGNARLWQGGHLIKGKKITYDLTTEMITVDRAEGVVQPGEGKKK